MYEIWPQISISFPSTNIGADSPGPSMDSHDFFRQNEKRSHVCSPIGTDFEVLCLATAETVGIEIPFFIK